MPEQQDMTQDEESNQTLKEADLQVAKILLDMMGYWENELEARTPDNNNKEVVDEQEKRMAEEEPVGISEWWAGNKFSSDHVDPHADFNTTLEEHDDVESPSHYMLFDGDVEVIDLVQDRLTPEEFIGYLKGNMIKYHMRAGRKGDLDVDLQKLRKYTDWLLEMIGA